MQVRFGSIIRVDGPLTQVQERVRLIQDEHTFSMNGIQKTDGTQDDSATAFVLTGADVITYLWSTFQMALSPRLNRVILSEKKDNAVPNHPYVVAEIMLALMPLVYMAKTDPDLYAQYIHGYAEAQNGTDARGERIIHEIMA